jgi:uncharacterized protein (DUF3084 family)
VELTEKEKRKAEGQAEKARIEKSEVEGKVEKSLNDKYEAEEKATKALKEKEEVKQMAQKVHATIQKLYKEVPEVPMVVEAMVEEQVVNISEAIKGLHMKITELEVRTTPGTPPEERAQRERTAQTTVEKIKILEHECINMCDEGTHIWTELTTNPELQSLEDKIRSKQEEVQ